MSKTTLKYCQGNDGIDFGALSQGEFLYILALSYTEDIELAELLLCMKEQRESE